MPMPIPNARLERVSAFDPLRMFGPGVQLSEALFWSEATPNKIWPFLKAEETQNLLGWISGGACAKRAGAKVNEFFPMVNCTSTRRGGCLFDPVSGECAELGVAGPGRGLRQRLGYPSATCEHGVMRSRVLAFLRDESNRALLGWIGGGLVVLATGLWAVFTFYIDLSKPSPPPTATIVE